MKAPLSFPSPGFFGGMGNRRYTARVFEKRSEQSRDKIRAVIKAIMGRRVYGNVTRIRKKPGGDTALAGGTIASYSVLIRSTGAWTCDAFGRASLAQKSTS